MSTCFLATSWLEAYWRGHWPMVLLLVVFQILLSVRVSRQMDKAGRSATRWFFITLFCTAIPAGVVMLWHNFGWLVRGKRSRDDNTTRRDQ